jgi:hypothetical protein
VEVLTPSLHKPNPSNKVIITNFSKFVHILETPAFQIKAQPLLALTLNDWHEACI